MESTRNVHSVSDYQSILARHVLANTNFVFNPRPLPYVQQGSLYTLKRNGDHTYCGIQVSRFNFFSKEYSTPSATSSGEALYTKGYAEIFNDEIKTVLREKIVAGLRSVTGKSDIYLPECDVTLRLSGLSSCLGGDVTNKSNPHFICSKAKDVFESLENVKITSKYNKNTQTIPCMYDNLVHSHGEYKNLKIFYDNRLGKYRVCNKDTGTFKLSSPISYRVEENFYSSFSNTLSGLLDIKIVGVYIKDMNTTADCIRVWAKLVESNLLTPFSEKAESVLNIEDEDDIDEDDDFDNINTVNTLNTANNIHHGDDDETTPLLQAMY